MALGFGVMLKWDEHGTASSGGCVLTPGRWSARHAAVLAIAVVMLGSSVVFGLPKLRVKWVYNVSSIAEAGFKWSCPILADLDGDGTQEVIVGTEKGGRLVAVRSNGQLYWVFPPMDQPEGPRLNKAHAADDIDGDGKMEVFVSGGTPPGAVFCLNFDGSVRWNWTNPEANFKYGGTIITDVDGDGVKDVITTGADSKVYLFSDTGELKWVTFLAPGRSIDSVPVAFDVDRDGDTEVLAFARSQGEGPGTATGMTGRLYCLSPSGQEEWSWTSTWADCLHAQPSIADVNGDGEYEIVLSLWKLDSTEAGGVVVLSFYGTELARRHMTKQVAHDPMIWDIDDDGTMDIVIGSREAMYYDFKPDLSARWSFNFTPIIGLVSKPLNQAGALGDVTGDGKIDIVFQSWQNSTIMILDRDGNLEVQPFNLPADATTAVVIGDVDNDGKSDIVACSGTSLYCLTLDAPYDPSTFVWPMLGRNPWHSGVVPIPESAIAALVLLALPLLRRR